MKFFLLIFIATAIFFIGFSIGISIKKRRMEKIKKQMVTPNDIVVQPQHPFIPFYNVVWKHPLDDQTQQIGSNGNPGKDKKPPFPKSTFCSENELHRSVIDLTRTIALLQMLKDRPKNKKENKAHPFPKSTIHRESEMPNERPRKSYTIVSDPDAALTPWNPLEIAALNQVMESMIEEEQDPNKFITKPDSEDHSHHFSGAGSSGGWMTSDDSRNNFSGAPSDNDGSSFGGSSYVIDDGSSGGGSSSFDSGSSSSSDW